MLKFINGLNLFFEKDNGVYLGNMRRHQLIADGS